MSKSKAPRSTQTSTARAELRRKQEQARKRAALQRNILVSVAVLALAVIVVGIVVVAGRLNAGINSTPPPPGGTGAPYVQSNSHYLQKVDNPKVTVVEFLDFQCPHCAETVPVVEQAMKDHPKDVDFVVRYFHLDQFPYSQQAMVTAESAGRQGKFTDMFRMLYANQAAWSQGPDPTQTFRGYAQQLGLDLSKFDADVKSPAVLARVQADWADGERLGVNGTPTIFVNGQKLDNPAALGQAINDALK